MLIFRDSRIFLKRTRYFFSSRFYCFSISSQWIMAMFGQSFERFKRSNRFQYLFLKPDSILLSNILLTSFMTSFMTSFIVREFTETDNSYQTVRVRTNPIHIHIHKFAYDGFPHSFRLRSLLTMQSWLEIITDVQSSVLGNSTQNLVTT